MAGKHLSWKCDSYRCHVDSSVSWLPLSVPTLLIVSVFLASFGAAEIKTRRIAFPAASVAAAADAAAKKLGTTLKAPFMTLSFMALLVIPNLKLSDKGLFDGAAFSFTPLQL